MGLSIKEWKSGPTIEGRATRPRGSFTVTYEVTVYNRRNSPLLLRSFRVLPPENGVRVKGAANQPPGRGPFDPRPLDWRIEPLLSGARDWPSKKIEGQIEFDGPVVKAVEIEIDAPHRWFLMAKGGLTVRLPVRPA